MPCNLPFVLPKDVAFTKTEYGTNIKFRLKVHSSVRRRIKIASDAIKTRYDRGANAFGFKEGDQMWLYNPQQRKGKSPNNRTGEDHTL